MKKLKIGVFGAWRGNNYVNLINDEQRAELVAVCDMNEEKLDSDKGLENVRLFRDFDSFLAYGKENGMQAVFLANYFHQHTPFAIRCMEAGMDVVSECTASATLRECASWSRRSRRRDASICLRRTILSP